MWEISWLVWCLVRPTRALMFSSTFPVTSQLVMAAVKLYSRWDNPTEIFSQTSNYFWNIFRVPVYSSRSSRSLWSSEFSTSSSSWPCWPWLSTSSGNQSEIRYQSCPLSLVVVQRVFACSSLVLYGIRDSWLPYTERIYYRRPYGIKNQRGASKKPFNAMGVFCVPKPPWWGALDATSWFFMA